MQLRLEDGTRVLPRLASAYDAGRDELPLLRFLANLQNADGTGALGWTWGDLVTAPYLPRVRSGRTLLALQTWNLDPGEDWRRLGLPRWTAVVDGEDELALDLDSAACRDLLDHEIARGHRRLREVWPLPEESPVTGSGGPYAAELVVAMTQTGPVMPEPRIAMAVGPGPRHLPGGEWLSLKVYCGTAAADAILLAARPLLAGCDWFFLRYADPGHHLRLRVRDGLDLLGAFHDLLDRPDVIRVQVDTYEPEVERYGGPDHIGTAERVFAVDSRTLIDLLPVGPDERWLLTLVAVDDLWGGTDLARIEAVRDAYARGLGFTTADRRAIGVRFRADRSALEDVRNPLLDRRFHDLAPLLATLPEDVIPSLAHMTVNRWLRARQREQEAVIYDLLARLRRSRQERPRQERSD